MRAQFAILAALQAAALCTPPDWPPTCRRVYGKSHRQTWTEAHYSRIFSRCAVRAGALERLT